MHNFGEKMENVANYIFNKKNHNNFGVDVENYFEFIGNQDYIESSSSFRHKILKKDYDYLNEGRI